MYMKNRKSFVSVGKFTSQPTEIACRVPCSQNLFNIYMLPPAQVRKNNNISYHTYADDRQMYITMTAETPYRLLVNASRTLMTECFTTCFQLNKNKTEVIAFWATKKWLEVCTELQSFHLKPPARPETK